MMAVGANEVAVYGYGLALLAYVGFALHLWLSGKTVTTEPRARRYFLGALVLSGAEATAGMEYPTLITTGALWWAPRRVRDVEYVTLHEFGHQYFQGLLASDEFAQPWLDEGLNSYANLLVYEDWFRDDAGDGAAGSNSGSGAATRSSVRITPSTMSSM